MRSTLLVILICLCYHANSQNAHSKRLQEIIEIHEVHKGYDRDAFPLGIQTRQYHNQEATFADSILQLLQDIHLDSLGESELISAELLSFVLRDKINYTKFERFLNPILSDAGFHASLPYRVRPIVNHQQALKYLKVLDAIPDYIDQHLVNIRAGLDKGVSQPRIIFNGYESTYDTHIVEDPEDSYFFSPFWNLPLSISDTQKDSLLTAAKDIITFKVTPAFVKVKAFFEAEYFPRTRTSIGISETPGGNAYYQDRINYYTTSTDYTAELIHNIGLSEVARIKSLMLDIIEELEFEGSFDDFFHFLRTDEQFYAKTGRELLMIARDMAKRADEQLPRFFKTLPRKPYGVAPVPEAIAPKYTAGRYVGTSENSTEPGYYWVNTYNLPSRTLYTMPALTVHEAVPGHHLQGSLNNELGDRIPKFRRNLYLSAYGEGWGLYCEYLADEMGMYTTPYERFGQLTYEMWRACRLVVDTGIHALGWTRDQVVEFMSSNTALSIHEINTETDRYISWPGQALSYKIGEIKIRELRKKAEAELGSGFDIREFHEIILNEGTVTLPILERRINQYIASAKIKN